VKPAGGPVIRETVRAGALFLFCLAAACGGGGGGGPKAFTIVSTVPPNGSLDMAPGTALAVTFSDPPDLATLTVDTLVLTRADGSPVGTDIVTAPANPRNVRVEPLAFLPADARFKLLIKGTIRSKDGVSLGADTEICFITIGPEPTVREDQIIDLGDGLNVPRYLAQFVHTANRWLVIGGHQSATETTDTVEEWDPGTRSFHLLPERLLSPRAEFTATVLQNGRILLVGGVAVPGGPPLATTEYFDPVSGSSPGPPLLEARRWHAASRFRGGALVSGGFGDTGDPLDSLEYLENDDWVPHPGHLGEPTAQHLQFLRGYDDVYVSVGNLTQTAALVDSVSVTPKHELDARFRSEGVITSDGRVMVVAGDTRSIVIHDFDTKASWLATKLLFDRRGAFSLTSWGSTGKRYLAAGGFQISAGSKVLRSLEIVEYLQNAGGAPGALIYTVTASELPVPMAGHVGFNDPSGATVLCGGIGDGVGDNLRRVVMILDDRTTPPATCK